MAEQSVDLRSTWAILRRNRHVLFAAAAVGAAAGIAFVLLRPPMYTSTSLVLLPKAQDKSGQVIARDVETEIRIAESEAVLKPAATSITPQSTVRKLSRLVEVSAPSSDVLQIDARAESPARAEAISTAVARAEVAFVSDASASQSSAEKAAITARRGELRRTLRTVEDEIEKAKGRAAQIDPTSVEGRTEATAVARLTAERANLVLQIEYLAGQASEVTPLGRATVIQSATPAERPGLLGWYVVYVFAGMILAMGLTSVFLAIFGRRDHRLRYRDDLADAVGSAVIASVPSRTPPSVAGWSTLLAGYSPATVDAWGLRQALRQLALHETAGRPRASDHTAGRFLHPRSFTVLTLSDDRRALAVGPQIASYAASIGIRTRLVPAQGHETAAPLWAACAGVAKHDEVRPGLLVGTQDDDQRVDLTIVLAVVDRRRSELDSLPKTSATVLAVSSGSATADDLARVAVSADDAGCRITGLIVADPDALDRTTGRLLERERSQQVPLPTRLTGVSAVKPGSSAGSRPRRRQR